MIISGWQTSLSLKSEQKRDFRDIRITIYVYLYMNIENILIIADVKRVRKWEELFLVSDNLDFIPELTELVWNELCEGWVIWQQKDFREG